MEGAYIRPDGASPICYEKDVTQKMVDCCKRTIEEELRLLANWL
jgi:hypothetical protein